MSGSLGDAIFIVDQVATVAGAMGRNVKVVPRMPWADVVHVLLVVRVLPARVSIEKRESGSAGPHTGLAEHVRIIAAMGCRRIRHSVLHGKMAAAVSIPPGR